MDSSRSGRVFLVGAGPGDPGLLTLRAAELLERADVLLYDALASDAIVALAPASCERIFVGKRAGTHAMPQAQIERLAIERARTGASVVRLKGGDPFVFGRGGEEAQALRAAGVPFEIVPGVSSAYAVPAYAGIPVTHRAHAAAFTVATGHEDPTKPASTLDYAKLADPGRTLVLLMATANLREIAEALVANGLAPATPVAVVQDGTRPSQRTVMGTLATICDEVEREQIGAPAIVVVGPVTELRSELRWFDTGPLFGKRVLVTRAGTQSAAFARALLARGAEPIFAPAIAIEPIENSRAADDALAALWQYAWIVFTSQNGVDAFFERLRAGGADARRLGSAKVAAIGDRTADRLRAHGVDADLIPPAFVSEEVAASLVTRAVRGDRILLYRAEEARDVLPRALEDAGLCVDVVAAYRTVVPNDPRFAEKVARSDVLTFTSASTVRGFVELLGANATPAEAAAEKCVACIGPITAAAAVQAGLKVDVVAGTFTTEGLLDALESYFAQQTC
ncbi:MAG TPA: uroporphyrinogen-III C-methyltransferase [Candidatus Cybelea sp.]|jgi:uroporphyrinogen III methyltransferase/synthase|nr:uroporphyrinogen-III C-methyltransferase [Candidatus Cybelea sp.]